MNYMAIQSLQTMHYVSKLDKKQFRFGLSWITVISASTLGVAMFV